MELRPILLSLRHHKAFALLICFQVALTYAAVNNAVFTAASTLREWNLPSGLTQDDVISVQAHYFTPEQELGAVIEADLERLAALPGVLNVTPATEIPFDAGDGVAVYASDVEDAKPALTNIFDGSAQFIDVLGLKLVEGRNFAEHEVMHGLREGPESQPAVTMLSTSLAKELFPGRSAVGQSVWTDRTKPPMRVVGVYSGFMNGEDLNWRGLSYHSLLRPRVTWTPRGSTNYLLAVEPGRAQGLLPDVRRTIYERRGRYVDRVERLTRTQKRMYDGRGSTAAVNLTISAILILITAFGIAGLMAFMVDQRRRQIGIRRALGATRQHILRYFLVENSLITGSGLFLGAVLTLGITHALTEASGERLLNLLYMLETGVGLWLVGLVAVWVPARRAMMVPPASVTRSL